MRNEYESRGALLMPRGNNSRPDRKGKRTIAGHVEEEIYREFKMLAAEELMTTDALVHEALELLFLYRREPEVLRRRLGPNRNRPTDGDNPEDDVT
jgi:hypothetical protein